MKKLLVLIISFFLSMSIVFAIDNAKVTMMIDENNHIKKQLIIDNIDNSLEINIPKNGKIPWGLYGYYIKLNDINSNIKYKLDNNKLILNDLDNQDRVVINTEYDISYRLKDGYEYFEIIEGIDKNIVDLNIQIKFEDDFEINDFQVYKNGEKTYNLSHFINDNNVSIKISNVNKNDVIGFQVKRSLNSKVSVLTILSFVFPIMCLVFSFVLWYFYGKDKKEKIGKRMNPVRQLSLLEVARLYNEKVSKKDVISLIFSLCSKGYIEIKETKDDIKFVRIKNYSGHSYSEGLLFDAIFLKSYVGTFEEVINKKKKEYNNEVSVKDVKVVRTIDRIMANENMDDKKYEFFERDTNSKRNIIIVMAIISIVLVTINPFITISNSFYFILALIIEIISFYILNKFIGFIDFNKIRKYIVPVLLTVILLMLIFAFILGTNSVYEIAYLFGIVCVVGMLILAKYMPKRNTYGDKMYHGMEEFRKLLEEGTKDEYQSILITNEDYYYNIISYTYIFGDKELVSKRFKNLVKKECTWYKSYKEFDYNSFNKTCDVIYNVLKENN